MDQTPLIPPPIPEGEDAASPPPGLPAILSGPRRSIFARLLANGVLQAALAFAVPLCLVPADPGALAPAWAAVLLGAVGLVLVGLRMAELGDAERLGQSFVAQSRMAVFDGLIAGTTRSSHGVAMTRLMNDLTALRNWVGLGLVRGMVAALSLAGALAAAVLLAGPMALAVAGPTLGVLALAALVYRSLADRVGRVRRVRGRLADRLSRALLRRERELARDGGLRARARVQRASDDLGVALGRRMQVIALLRAAPESVVPLAVAIALVMGAETPDATQVGIVLLAGLAAGPLRVLARAVEYRVAFVVARDRLAPALDTAKPGAAATPVPDDGGE